MIHLGVGRIVEDYWQQSSALGDVAAGSSSSRSTWGWEFPEGLWEGLVWGVGVSISSGSDGTSSTVGLREWSSLARVSWGTGLGGRGMSAGLNGSCAGRGGIVECRKGEIFRRYCLFLLVMVLEPSTLTV